MANEALKKEIKDSGVRLWQVADALGITDCTFSKKLRKELSNTQKQEIRTILSNLTKEVM